MFSFQFEKDNTGATVRGRPRLSEIQLIPAKRSRASVPLPEIDVRLDCISHWPRFDDSQNRCRANCGKKTMIKCSKCNVYLCLVKDRNCFMQFHTQK